MAERITIVLGHLQMESIYLDTVIESGLEIQAILREQRERQTSVHDETQDSGEEEGMPVSQEAQPSPADSETPLSGVDDEVTPPMPKPTAVQLERNARISERLAELRSEISTRFLPVLEARKKLPGILKQFDPAGSEAPSLTSLSFLVGEPYRTKLKSLRDEIKNKLNQVYSITMGNQTVLIYTLNYYDQLLNGNNERPDYYNSNGQTQAQAFYAASFLKANC